MLQRTAITLLALCMLQVLNLGAAQADSLESMIMPGKVIKGHAKYEQECSNCHRLLSKEDQSALCLDCHKEIAADFKKKQGFHGRLGTHGPAKCKSCHTEHIGRDADIVKFDSLSFDHHQTDFPLHDRHQNVGCTSCHAKGKKFREASTSCIACHKKDSPHKNSTDKDMEHCTTCHTEQAWRAIKFDHNKTHYRLKGGHTKATCAACHVRDRYKNTPDTCYACHKVNDIHNGKSGNKCEKCHNSDSWSSLSFDHNRKTKFPLFNKHTGLRCAACHKEDAKKVKIKMTCVSCHQFDDVHKGNYGDKCEKCHSDKGWKTSKFDHDRQTKFSLRGKHKDATCTACHKSNPYTEKLSSVCRDCHQLDDVHKGQQGKQCQNCHNETGWGNKVRFDHDLTKFPLIGLHASQACEACHLSTSYKDVNGKCYGCHKQDDTHKRRLGEQCQQCHNPNGWKIWRFNHNSQSKFKIDGAHKQVHCYACHSSGTTLIERGPRPCIACHRTDDTHNGQFGDDCARCHSTRSFKDIDFKR